MDSDSGHDARLSRVVARALRHEPWLYELELDEAGWTGLAALVAAIQNTRGFASIQASDVQRMVETSPKQRYELQGDRIRARYGHSVPGRIIKKAAAPPVILFHGTSPKAWPHIQRNGLLPMARQYVHLAASEEMAQQVGSRKALEPVIIRVRAGAAHRDGVQFWQGNDLIWLASHIPAEYLTLAHDPVAVAGTTLYRCPVCNFNGLTVPPYTTWPPPADEILTPPYEDQLGQASYEVCPRCGFEFGFDDNPGTARPVTFESFRSTWEAEGMPWFAARDNDLLTRFLMSDATSHVREILMTCAGERTEGKEEFTFNLYDVEIDVDQGIATIGDALDKESSLTLPLQDFLLELRTRPSPKLDDRRQTDGTDSDS